MPTARPSDAIRILLADDHRLYVEAMRASLSSDPRLEVVGVAFDGAEAVRLAAELSPDIVLMDVEMPVMDGIDATRLICERDATVRVLIVTSSESPQQAARARDAGAAGFIHKSRSAAELMDALADVSTLLVAFGPLPSR